MSFILEALRKSAHARDRQVLPHVVNRPTLDTRRSAWSWWLGGFTALLLVNVGVLLFVLFRPSNPTSAPPSGVATVAHPAAMGKVSQRVIRPLATESQPGDTTVEGVEPPTSTPAFTAPRGRPVDGGHGTLSSAPSLLTPPSVTQLPAQATAGLPPLNLELHVYSADPSQRFVIINGERLHEGGALKAGAQVEKITAEGVVLSYQGTRFSLP